MGTEATKWFEKKAQRKDERRIKSEKAELKNLGEKYIPRPFPITVDPGVAPDGKKFMSLDQMVRYQALKLDYEYKQLREEGKTHDEAEKIVFPEAYQYRLDREAEQEALDKARGKSEVKENV